MPRLPRNFRRRPDTGAVEVAIKINGKLYRKSLSSKLPQAEAIRRGLAWMAALQPAPTVNVNTVADAAKSWLAEKATTTRCADAVQNAQASLLRHVLPVIGTVALADVSSRLLWAVRASADAKLKPSTVASVMSTLRAVLVNACAWDAVKYRGVVPVPPSKPPDRLDDAEVHAILEAAGKWRPMVLLALTTGIRWGELRGLKRKHYNRQPAPHLLLERTKANGFRRVPLNQQAVDVIESLIEERKPMHPEAWIVENRRLNPPRFNVPGVKWHWHQLRHTYASQTVEEGMDLAILSELLGHSSIRTTQIYARPSAKAVGLAIRGITFRITADEEAAAREAQE